MHDNFQYPTAVRFVARGSSIDSVYLTELMLISSGTCVNASTLVLLR